MRGLTTSLLFLFLFINVQSLAGKQKQFNAAAVEREFVKIPAGTFILSKNTEGKQQTDSVRVESFYLQKGELSNRLYLYYLQDLVQKKDTLALLKALPDTLVWRTKLVSAEPFVSYYLRHPAYQEYPLVGVSHQQALLFCEWLSNTYHAFPKRKFKRVRFDLPSENEWMYAASGGQSYSPFPWPGPFIRNSRGDYLANHINRIEASLFPDTCSGMPVFRPAELLGDLTIFENYSSDITAPAVSYWPNAFGLYNMSGNAEEMVKEDGIAKGGSWRDYPWYLQIRAKQYYQSEAASSERGFRVKMELIEE